MMRSHLFTIRCPGRARTYERLGSVASIEIKLMFVKNTRTTLRTDKWVDHPIVIHSHGMLTVYCLLSVLNAQGRTMVSTQVHISFYVARGRHYGSVEIVGSGVTPSHAGTWQSGTNKAMEPNKPL